MCSGAGVGVGVLVGTGVGVGVAVGKAGVVSVTCTVVSAVKGLNEHALNTNDAISIARTTIQMRLRLLLITFKYCSLPRESQNQYQESVILQKDLNSTASRQASGPVSSGR